MGCKLVCKQESEKNDMNNKIKLHRNYFYDYSRLCGCLMTRFKMDGISSLSLWGMGKNGHFLLGLLTSCNISVDQLCDDYDTGFFGKKAIKQTKEYSANGTPVFLTLDPSTPAFELMIEKLRNMNVPHYTLRDFLVYSNNKQANDKSELSFHKKNDEPVAHRSVRDDLAEYRDYRIRQFRKRHEGQRCVIMGNGPSLNNTDFSLLQNEICFGLNKIFLLFRKTTFRPDYICCYIKDVVSQCREQLLALHNIPIFISHESLDIIPPGHNHIYHLGPQQRFSFSQDVMEAIYVGFTVTYAAIQLAVYMGFKDIILIGVDHNFAGYDGAPNQWHKIEKARHTHFDPNYFATGQFWQAPDYKMIETHFTYARDVCRFLGVRIIDATDGGKLQVFEKMSLIEALQQNSA